MRLVLAGLLVLHTLACARVEASRQPVEVEMSNVDLHVTDDVTLHIRHLRGRFLPAGSRQAPYLDDKNSYSVSVDTGQVAIDLASLNALMKRTLAAGRANVDNLQISIDEQGKLRQKGRIDKAIDIPFSVKAGVELTPHRHIRVRSESVKGFGVPIRPVMKLFSIEMDDLLKIAPGHGVRVEGNDLILDPATLLPPPAMHGRLTAVRIEGTTLVQTFGSGERRRLTPSAIAKNYIYWRSGQLAFGKLTMNDTDLELVDVDPDDPFDFSVEHWNDQLVAGYSKTTVSRGLKAHVPDYNDLRRRRTTAAR